MELAANECYGAGRGKLVLKRVASRYLPEEWLNRPKRGFGLPMNLWSADTLLPAARELLLSSDSHLGRLLDRKRLIAFLENLEREFSAYQAWSLLILEHWLRSHSVASLSGPLPRPSLLEYASTSMRSAARRYGRAAMEKVRARRSS
jgi:asparagine synthase (glutamine-hydrolysing)